LPDPYDPIANRKFRSPPYWLHDLSLYRNKLYLYFGPTPAVVLFAPWQVVMKSALPQRVATAVFCSIGFLAAALLASSVYRRCFGPLTVVQAGLIGLVLGLAAGVPLLLQRAETWEACIACGYALLMISLAALWQAMVRPQAAARWMAVASIALAGAIGARPSLVCCSGALLPVLWLHRRVARVWVAGLVPLLLGGVLILAYNQMRFHNPFDFGQRYQLADDRQLASGSFSLRYLWFNLRVYFFQPVRWTAHFPFVAGAAQLAPPAGHAPIDDAYGIFSCIPIALLAFAAPLAWRCQTGSRRSGGSPLVRAESGGPPLSLGCSALRRFALCLALAFGGAAGVLCLFYGDCARYELEFLPALLLFALLGVWGIDRALASRPAAQRLARAGIAALLVVSVGFNLCAAAARHQREQTDLSNQRANLAALWLQDGNALARAGHLLEAGDRYREASKLKPDYAAAYCNLGSTLAEAGKPAEAEAQFRAALRCDPNYVEAEYNLAAVLVDQNRKAEAGEHFARARALKPDLPAIPGLP